VLLKVVNVLQFKVQTVTSVQLRVCVPLKVENIRQFKKKTVASFQLTICVTISGKKPTF
jgi:hypothetical protein